MLSVAFSPDGTRIVTGSGKKSEKEWQASEIKIWDVTTRSEVVRLVGENWDWRDGGGVLRDFAHALVEKGSETRVVGRCAR